MSRFRQVLVLALVIAMLAPAVVSGCGETPAQQAYVKAQDLQEQQLLTKAYAEYEKAHKLFMEEGDRERAMDARHKAQSVMLIMISYPDLKEDIEEKLVEMYPKVDPATLKKFVTSGEVEHVKYDGKVYYFNQAAENIATRHFDIAYMNTEKSEAVAQLVRTIAGSSGDTAVTTWQPYSNPLTWVGTHTVAVPRGELPKTGLAKVWFPLPVEMGPQQNNVSLVSVTPDTWVKQPPSTEGPLSDLYMEIPLDKLSGDLNIEVKFQFTHYQENFRIDPANVGTYDRSSALFKQYTRSYGNTYISDEIRETAKKVVGAEKNPYLAAKKLYEYILKEIKYSYMPHMAMWPRGERESEYVQRLKRGDCGAQAMYFSAMCRSLGIPARTTGGWQLFTGNFAGHFWAEFFLPNYGWIPVDPTAADIADWTDKISEKEREEFKAFYFGNQDPLRCNVQLDVDEKLAPPIDGELVVTLALQNPDGTCDTMDMPLGTVLIEHSQISAELVAGEAPVTISGPMH